MRSLFLKSISRCLDLVDVPPSFTAVSKNASNVTVVAQSDSILIEGLLSSFARRLGLAGAAYGAACPRQSGVLYLCSLHDGAALERSLAAAPKFSTLNIFQGRGPMRSNPRYHIGFWQLISALLGQILKSRYYLSLFGEPFEPAPRAHAARSQISRRLKLDFYQKLKHVRGTPLQPIETQAKVILGGREFEREVALLAKRHGKDTREIKRLARREFYAVAARPGGFVLGVCDILARLLLSRLFTQVVSQGLDRFSALTKQHPTILVPMHRSHLDYILIGSKLYEANLTPPLVASGINLAFWPAGALLRRAGGYFVRREASQDFIHSFILQRYVTYLIKRGHLQEFFIEGGRSRSGRMLPPKHGLLSIVTSAFLKGVRRDILFVPVSISYENVVEERAYSEENSGELKRRENLWELLKARKIFRKKYGEVIVNFGDPLSLAAFTEAWRLSEASTESDRKSLVIHLGDALKQRISEQISISLTGLVHTALLMAPRYGLKRGQLADTVSQLATIAGWMRSQNPETGDLTPSLRLFLEERQDLLYESAYSGGIIIKQLDGTDVFLLPPERRITADFYRNSCIHRFFGVGLMALVQLLEADLSIPRLMRYCEVFSPDFLPIKKEDTEACFTRLTELLIKRGILRVSGGRTCFADPSAGYFFPALLWAYIESLLWVDYQLTHLPAPPPPENECQSETALKVFSYDDFLKRLQKEFPAALALGLLERSESSSKASLSAALDNLRQRKVISIYGQKHDKKIVLRRDCSAEVELLKSMSDAVKRRLEDERIGYDRQD